MIISINNQQVDYVSARYYGKEVMVGIDSSKTNSAFTIGDMNGNILDYVEFDGKDDGTTEQDTLVLCATQRKTLAELFRGSKPRIVGIENIITKDSKRMEVGISIHMSRFKITAVFMSFISFFQDTFAITPELINNQTWKSTVLPAKFCKREYAKGSLVYFKSINSKYQYCSDDVTDSICILEYLCKMHDIQKGYQIGEAEAQRHEFTYFFTNTRQAIYAESIRFFYNSELSLNQNIIVAANIIKEEVYGFIDIPIHFVSIDDIYKRGKGTFNNVENTLRVVVKRV